MTAEIRSTLEKLVCSKCATEHDAGELQTLCRDCGAVLLPRYRLEEAARTLTRDALVGRRDDQWRYAEVLPGSEAPVGLGEGMTPIHPAPRLGASMGLRRLFIKDESLNPTGSFKARGMSAAVTMAVKLGAKELALPSAGNAGGAAAAYGAKAGLPVTLYLPADTPAPFRQEAEYHGASVHLVDGDIADCGAEVRKRATDRGWFDLSTLKEPYRLEGKKTMGYELAEQFDWDLPDVVVYPTGGGTGLIGMWKAFEELEQMGLVEPGRRPRMVVVQSTGCAPMVKAWEQGEDHAPRWENPQTYASGLRVPAAVGDHLILGAVRESDGVALAVPDEAMDEGQRAMAALEGIFPAPEGGATVAAIRRMVEEGSVGVDERVVLFNTGTGLKYPDRPAGLD